MEAEGSEDIPGLALEALAAISSFGLSPLQALAAHGSGYSGALGIQALVHVCRLSYLRTDMACTPTISACNFQPILLMTGP